MFDPFQGLKLKVLALNFYLGFIWITVISVLERTWITGPFFILVIQSSVVCF